MPLNLNEVINSIKKVGASAVRTVPMSGENVNDGNYQIEIRSGDMWTPIVTGVKKPMAEDIIRQAVNRVIIG